jgi:hypothetical protein
MVGIPLLGLTFYTTMKFTMKTYRKLLALFLIGLFLAFSFNAHACLIAIYNGMEVNQGRDCTMPGEEPVSQFCDTFKTLAVHSGHDTPATGHSHLPLIGEPSLLLPDLVRSRTFFFPPDDGDVVFQQDLLLLISVFRI